MITGTYLYILNISYLRQNEKLSSRGRRLAPANSYQYGLDFQGQLQVNMTLTCKRAWI